MHGSSSSAAWNGAYSALFDIPDYILGPINSLEQPPIPSLNYSSLLFSDATEQLKDESNVQSC